MASFIFAHCLKQKGWTYLRGNGLIDYLYIPGSLKELKKGDLLNEATDGIHYAGTDEALADMVEKYGLEHAPKDLNDVGKELTGNEKKCLADIHNTVLEVMEKHDKKERAGKLCSFVTISVILYNTLCLTT